MQIPNDLESGGVKKDRIVLRRTYLVDADMSANATTFLVLLLHLVHPPFFHTLFSLLLVLLLDSQRILQCTCSIPSGSLKDHPFLPYACRTSSQELQHLWHIIQLARDHRDNF